MLHLFLQSAAADQTAGTSLNQDKLAKINFWCNFPVRKLVTVSCDSCLSQLGISPKWKTQTGNNVSKRPFLELPMPVILGPLRPGPCDAARGCSHSLCRWRVGPFAENSVLCEASSNCMDGMLQHASPGCSPVHQPSVSLQS